MVVQVHPLGPDGQSCSFSLGCCFLSHKHTGLELGLGSLGDRSTVQKEGTGGRAALPSSSLCHGKGPTL